jgi:ATP-dependent Clp protease ATP-binding subunit ClpA
MHPRSTPLDPKLHSSFIRDVERQLRERTAGQDGPISQLMSVLETYFAGYNDPNMPVGVMLFLGPSGVGKTSLIENLCDILFGNPKAHVRMNCADFRESHQTNRLVGAPPGYVGFKDKSVEQYLTQENLNKHHTEDLKFNVVLLDEIEEAHSALYDWFLAIFNDGEGMVGGKLVDFRNTLFVMTSNLGTSNKSSLLGFSHEQVDAHNKKNEESIKKAIAEHFKKKFLNRIDETVIFEALTESMIDQIFDIQVGHVRRRILTSKQPGPQFVFRVLDPARKEIVRRGFDVNYGARPLKRVLKRILVDKLALLVRSGQVQHGDLVVIGYDKVFTYEKYNGDEVGRLSDHQWDDFRTVIDQSFGSCA